MKEKKSKDDYRRALATPEGFAKLALGLNLYEKQSDVLKDLSAPGSRVLFRCGNEVGKTALCVTTAILWHMSVFPKGQVISTAGAWRQVTHQLVPNLKKQAFKFPKSWVFNSDSIVIDGVPRYVGFSTSDDRRSQGYHGNDTEPLLAIIDEAASVPDDVFHAFEERCNPQRLLITGSPLDPMGMFYRNSTEFSKFYSQHKLTQPECPHIAREAIFRTIEKYDRAALEGVDRDKPDWSLIESRCSHPVVLSRIFAAFYKESADVILALRDWENCVNNPPQNRPGDRKAFCDFAAGGDENVLAVRVGNRVWIEKAWKESNPMAAVGELATLFNKLKHEHGFEPNDIEGDASGMGIVYISRLKELGWPIQEFYGQSKARLDSRYFNRISEVWIEGIEKIRKREIILENDADLKGQVCSRRWHKVSEGHARIEGKDDLLRRGLESPDRADAVFGAMQPGLVKIPSRFDIIQQDKSLMIEGSNSGGEISQDVLTSLGFNAGF